MLSYLQYCLGFFPEWYLQGIHWQSKDEMCGNGKPLAAANAVTGSSFKDVFVAPISFLI